MVNPIERVEIPIPREHVTDRSRPSRARFASRSPTHGA